MRVGFAFYSKDKYLSGVEHYSLGLIKALSAYVPNNEYIVFANRAEIVHSIVGRRTNVVVRQVAFPRTRACRTIWEHVVLPRLVELARLDVLHCPCYICPMLPSRVPYVVTVHDTIALDHPSWCTWSNAVYYKLLMRKAVKRAATVVAVSEQTSKDLCRHVALASDRISVISPGIDLSFRERRQPYELDTIRMKYGLPDSYILHVGNVEPKKNLLGLLQAYARLEKRRVPHSLVLVGRRHWKARNVFEQCRHWAGTGKIVLTGYIRTEDLPGVYQMASAYVCPSLYEGFGFPPLEAMASGIPVLSSHRGALRKTVGEAAYRIDPRDPVQMAAAITHVLTDKYVRLEYVHRGSMWCRQFDWQRSAEATAAVYSQVRR